MRIIDINELLKKGVQKLPNGRYKLDKIINGVRYTMTRDSFNEILVSFSELVGDKLEYPTFLEVFNRASTRKNFTNYTKHKSEVRMNNYFENIKNLPTNKITNTLIVKDIEYIQNRVENNEISCHYANSLLRILKYTLEFAFEEGLLAKNINFKDITLYKVVQERSQKTEENYLTFEEFKEFCDVIMKIEKPLFTKITSKGFVYILTLLYYTGARINEARAIKCKDIELFYDRQNKTEFAVIYIKGQLKDGKNIYSERQKNGSKAGRTVYIPYDVYDYLTACIEEFELKPDDFAFDLEHSGNPKTRSRISDYLKGYTEYAIENKLLRKSFPRVTPHGFRHSHTFYLQGLGVSPQEAAKMQGHTVQVMLNYYTRSDKSELARIFANKN